MGGRGPLHNVSKTKAGQKASQSQSLHPSALMTVPMSHLNIEHIHRKILVHILFKIIVYITKDFKISTSNSNVKTMSGKESQLHTAAFRLLVRKLRSD